MDHETKLLYGNGGKRGPPAPLSSESDEGEVLDLDEKPPSSPSSSTSSGPIYVRPPGFNNHGKDIKLKKQDTLLKTKKKLKLQPFSSEFAIASTRFKPQSSEGGSQKHVVNKQLKPKRDPMPMRRRALPQSFWQQPNSPASLPPGSTYTVLPPLWKHEKTNEDLSEVRPVTPPDERDKNSDEKKEPKQSRRPIRTIRTTAANTDLLYSLFDVIDVEKKSSNIIKRGRPKKVNRTDRNKNLVGDDPFMVQSVESLLPSLSLETGGNQAVTPLAHLSVVSVRDGDNTLSLPSLTIDQNYPALLSEVVKAL
ncbi:uncharacterized protein LOC117121396 [Anneissia japonica]|uniref:uncharacterized protein LOC117121396 n=1 Tax=Anneissia japonica TaxID=1529436 RepID=UPI0014259B41|nr:uncharacterized protein LOC117121396 [Anneissia japonica]